MACGSLIILPACEALRGRQGRKLSTKIIDKNRLRFYKLTLVQSLTTILDLNRSLLTAFYIYGQIIYLTLNLFGALNIIIPTSSIIP